jgi:hypothetical protein
MTFLKYKKKQLKIGRPIAGSFGGGLVDNGHTHLMSSQFSLEQQK